MPTGPHSKQPPSSHTVGPTVEAEATFNQCLTDFCTFPTTFRWLWVTLLLNSLLPLIPLDQSAAFYTINHHILLSKLTNIGIKSKTHWFEFYPIPMHLGKGKLHYLATWVAQGSVHGLLLFAMCPHWVPSSTHGFSSLLHR